MKYFLIFFLIPFSLKANFEEKKQIDTINVGYYIDDIYDINYVKGTYRITLFAWVTSTTVKYDFNQFLDIHHAIDKKYVLDSKQILDKQLANSSLISEVNEKERNNYFFEFEKMILSFRKKIEADLEF